MTRPARWSGTGAGEPVGIAEIADRAGVAPITVRKWIERHADFPASRWTVSGRDAWEWAQVWTWLLDTGRYPDTSARGELVMRLADAVEQRLRAADGGWVPWDDLLTLAPEGRRIVITDGIDIGTDGWSDDHPAGAAYDAGPSGRPDGGMVGAVLGRLRRRLRSPDEGVAARIEEGYPDGGPRALRIVTA